MSDIARVVSPARRQSTPQVNLIFGRIAALLRIRISTPLKIAIVSVSLGRCAKIVLNCINIVVSYHIIKITTAREIYDR